MAKRFWVIGGEYADCDFQAIQPGTEKLSGPYTDELRARMEWQRLTFKDRHAATERYAICVEPELKLQ